MNYNDLNIEQLQALMHGISAERRSLKERGRRIQEVLHRKLEEDHLDHWGVTAEQYAEAKVQAQQEGKALSAILTEMARTNRRAARQAQTVQVQTASVGVQGAR